MKRNFKIFIFFLCFVLAINSCSILAYAQAKKQVNLRISNLDYYITMDSPRKIKNTVFLSVVPDAPIKLQCFNNNRWENVKSVTPKSKKVVISYPDIWQKNCETQFRLVVKSNKVTNKYVSNIINIVYKNKRELALSCKSAVIIDSASLQTIYEKNPSQRLPMASITKLMTILLTLERCRLDEIVTVPAEAANLDNNVLGLKTGEKYTVMDMLYGMILPSANECAITMAYHISGSTTSFVALMNKRAKELKLSNTHYASCFGQHSPAHFTSVVDITLLHKQLIKNSTFCRIAKCKDAYIKPLNAPRSIYMETTNIFLDEYPNMIAGKTGTSPNALYCNTISIKIRSKTYIIALLGASSYYSRAADVRKLVSYIENNK